MKKILLGLSGIFAILPGIVTIQNGLGTPDQYKFLFGGVVEGVGILILLLLYNQKNNISNWPIVKLRKFTFLSIIGFVVSLILYISLVSIINIKHESRGNLVFPIYCKGELKEMVDKSGSRLGAIEKYGIDAVEELITEQPEFSFIVTKVILLLIFTLTFSFLTFAFGINGFYKKDM